MWGVPAREGGLSGDSLDPYMDAIRSILNSLDPWVLGFNDTGSGLTGVAQLSCWVVLAKEPASLRPGESLPLLKVKTHPYKRITFHSHKRCFHFNSSSVNIKPSPGGIPSTSKV